MIITFIDYWNKDKDKLEEWFKSLNKTNITIMVH